MYAHGVGQLFAAAGGPEVHLLDINGAPLCRIDVHGGGWPAALSAAGGLSLARGSKGGGAWEPDCSSDGEPAHDGARDDEEDDAAG